MIVEALKGRTKKEDPILAILKAAAEEEKETTETEKCPQSVEIVEEALRRYLDLDLNL